MGRRGRGGRWVRAARSEASRKEHVGGLGDGFKRKERERFSDRMGNVDKKGRMRGREGVGRKGEDGKRDGGEQSEGSINVAVDAGQGRRRGLGRR